MDTGSRIEGVGSADNDAAILPPEVEQLAIREWHRLSEELANVHSQIEELQTREEMLAAQVGAWIVILSSGGQDPRCETEDADSRDALATRRVPSPQESADVVVGLLRETGQAMHYREIYDTLRDRGIEVKGKNPPNTLLARFFDDPRLERVGQGTYQIKQEEEVEREG